MNSPTKNRARRPSSTDAPADAARHAFLEPSRADRVMKRLALLIALLLLWTPVLNAQDLGTDAQREAGKQVYDQKCAHCHGENGDASSIAALRLRPAPRDFTSGIYKFRTTSSVDLPTDDDIKRSIRRGMPYTSMPAWQGVLSETQITNLVYYIKTFNADFAGEFGTPTPVNIPNAPRYSEANLERGRQVYEENQCLDCHGDQGRGNGKSAPTLHDDWSHPIRPADLTKRWTFRASSTREDVYRTFITGLTGSPMPSYEDIPEEDRWALVDYIWSLSRDEAAYATVVTAHRVDGAIDLSQGALFDDAPAAYFPVVGQVIEPGRAFHPGVNGVEVKAIYNQDEVALQLSWHDMTAQTTGANSPTLDAPLFGAAPDSAASDSVGAYSDAVAVMVPSQMPQGVERPYFMFGDADNAMDIWFADLARGSADFFVGQGRDAIAPGDQSVEMASAYDDGQWTVAFKRARLLDGGLSFEEGAFVPVTFSVWDGFNDERGNKRGLTAWYHLYVPPLETQSAALPMAQWGLITLLLELGLIFVVRRRKKKAAVTV